MESKASKRDKVELSSDAPKLDPAHDAFGYARFAKALADAVRTTPSPKGLVMAIDGPWGSGKSTLLNFVKHYLAATQGADVPIVIEANPWWFADHEALAGQFLGQFGAQLPKTSERLKQVGDALAEYSNEIGKVAESGIGIPMSGMFIGWSLGKLKAKPKDVPRLKKEISEYLQSAGQRVVMVVDDIDRLAPEEVRQVFKVIKALADFPNVVYLMAFDRRVVAEALSRALGISDGDAYLEKIVQVPFVLPVVPRAKLLQKFIDDLNRVFGDADDKQFSMARWGGLFQEGLAPLITKPRDIVRIINALTVTLPVVRGEVNSVDFIALEFLRVFVPEAYRMLRENQDLFVGASDRDKSDKKQREQKIHDDWISGLLEAQRKPVKAIVEQLFPRLASLWGGFSQDSKSVGKWNAELRVASPNMFPRFFQFGVEEGALSRAELQAFIGLGADDDAIVDAWLGAINYRRPDGSTKAREMLERLIEIDDLDPTFVRGCLAAIFRVGDEFLNARDSIPGFFSIQPSIQIYWLVHHLFKCLPEADRESLMLDCVRDAQALAVSVEMTDSIDKMLQPTSDARDSVFQKFAPATLASMKTFVVAHLRLRAAADLLTVPDLPYVLRCWGEWDSNGAVQQWLQGVIASPDGILRLLRHYMQVGSTHSSGDTAPRRTVSMNPKLFEPYLPPPMDLSGFESIVGNVSTGCERSSEDQEAIEAFRRAMKLIHRGRDPGALLANIDLDD